MNDTHGLTKTLGKIDFCRDKKGQIQFTVGNSAAVFRIRYQGENRSLRCYMRPTRHLKEIYGEKLLKKELFLYTASQSGRWVDVILGDWIEGETLQERIVRAALGEDKEQLAILARAFDTLAAELLADDWAHGDLKPENIIVDPSGKLHLIDFDATFLPAFAGERSPELGTAAFQHPARTMQDFNASLDDYPAALISTALHALMLDPELYARYSDIDGLLFSPQQIASDRALREAIALFEQAGLPVQYRIAQLLYAPTLRLPGIARLFKWAAGDACRPKDNIPTEIIGSPKSVEKIAKQLRNASCRTNTATAVIDSGKKILSTMEPIGDLRIGQEDATPELFVENGLWGYRVAQQTVIAPLYDNGFDFTEGLAAVCIGKSWHFIDPAGRVRIRCAGFDAVKPFRNGRATVIRNGQRFEIDHSGHEFEI